MAQCAIARWIGSHNNPFRTEQPRQFLALHPSSLSSKGGQTPTKSLFKFYRRADCLRKQRTAANAFACGQSLHAADRDNHTSDRHASWKRTRTVGRSASILLIVACFTAYEMTGWDRRNAAPTASLRHSKVDLAPTLSVSARAHTVLRARMFSRGQGGRPPTRLPGAVSAGRPYPFFGGRLFPALLHRLDERVPLEAVGRAASCSLLSLLPRLWVGRQSGAGLPVGSILARSRGRPLAGLDRSRLRRRHPRCAFARSFRAARRAGRDRSFQRSASCSESAPVG